jgi:DNA-binding NtrC family response regulator
MAAIFVIDDDAGFRGSLAETLADFGHRIGEFDRAVPALAAIAKTPPDLVFLDLRMPEMDGIEALRRIRTLTPALPVIVLTAFATGENTIAAMRLGAFDHLTKPVGRVALQQMLDRALARPDSPQPDSEPIRPGEIVGASAAIREVQKRIGLAAASDATVLILGETGSGKELVARAIHRFSDRAARAFIAVNCAAIPGELLESELFGHEKGAFTGAAAARRGRFREADGGTLLLDEIGDMPEATQAKILRVLQEREVAPLGGQPVRLDVRVIAATHQDLPARVASGRFRADLYYRLAVLPITVPPLRERAEDIPALARHILAELRPAAPPRLTEAAIARLAAHAWPGNVRELRNMLERAASLTRGGVLDADDLALPASAPDGSASLAGAATLAETMAATEEAMIRAALTRAAGNRSEAARLLGISRQALYDRLKRYGLDAG